MISYKKNITNASREKTKTISQCATCALSCQTRIVASACDPGKILRFRCRAGDRNRSHCSGWQRPGIAWYPSHFPCSTASTPVFVVNKKVKMGNNILWDLVGRYFEDFKMKIVNWKYHLELSQFKSWAGLEHRRQHRSTHGHKRHRNQLVRQRRT